jgi:thiamine-phosphate pyrophosphorylase
VFDRSFPPLHAIVDVTAADRAGWEPAALAAAFLAGGATVLQVRAKDMASAPLLNLCRRIVELARPYAGVVIVNDRVDVAKLSGAAGVHLGQDDLSPVEARAILGPDAIIGFSTHTLEQVQRAIREPISYLAVGPVFGTTTKDTGYAAVGLDLVASAARAAGACPIVSIGGITLDNASSVLAAGATSVAVIGDLLVTADPQARVGHYVRQLARHRV